MTYHARRAKAAAYLRPHEADDRRQYHRFDDHGLIARIGDKLVEVHDISVGGIRVARFDAAEGSAVTLTLLPRVGRRVDLGQSHRAEGEVVGHVGGWTRIRFPRLSYSLAKFIIHHLGRRNGVQPYIFR